MVKLDDFVGLLTKQHIHQVTNPKSLIGSVDDAQRFLGRVAAFPGFNRHQTGVAVTALFAARFIEISEQSMATTS